MYLPKILEDLKYSSIKIGIILAIIPMVRFLMPFLFLRKFKLTKKVFLLSLFLSLIASIMLLFTIKNYYLLLFSNLLAGFGMTITYPYIELLTMDV